MKTTNLQQALERPTHELLHHAHTSWKNGCGCKYGDDMCFTCAALHVVHVRRGSSVGWRDGDAYRDPYTLLKP
jgi:hypothetical protein